MVTKLNHDQTPWGILHILWRSIAIQESLNLSKSDETNKINFISKG